MIGFQRQRQMFAAQFQPEGEGFVYRKHSIGEPIRISAADRERFIADFETFTRQGFWAMVAGAVVLVAVFVALWYATATRVPDTVFYLVFGAMLLLYMAGSFRAWNRPLRELTGRS